MSPKVIPNLDTGWEKMFGSVKKQLQKKKKNIGP